MIRLICHPHDPRAEKLRRILALRGLSYDLVDENMLDQLLSGDILDLIGRPPTLELDGQRLTHANSILQALDERQPTPSLWPDTAPERALCLLLSDWADQSLFFYQLYLRYVQPNNQRVSLPSLTGGANSLAKIAANVLLPWQAKTVSQRQGTGRKDLPQLLSDLDGLVAALADLLGDRDWLIGSHITLADISVYAQLFALMASEEAAGLVVARPKLYSWVYRVDQATQKA